MNGMVLCETSVNHTGNKVDGSKGFLYYAPVQIEGDLARQTTQLPKPEPQSLPTGPSGDGKFGTFYRLGPLSHIQQN